MNESVQSEQGALSLPRVTVVVPTHNRAELLGRLLDSLVAQDYPHDRYEILVVHNIGHDNTEGIVRAKASAAPMRIAYYAKNNRGPMPSRQFGAEEAAGEYVVFIDDDCVATPSWLRALMAGFDYTIGIVQGRTVPHPGQPRRLLEKTVDVQQETPYYETCNIAYRKAAIEAAGGFSMEFAEQRAFYGEDTDLGWKVKARGWRSAFAPGALVYHEVFSVSFQDWLMEPRRMHVWPFLIRRHPQLRRHMCARYFLDRRTATFNFVLIGLIAAPAVHPAMLLLALPYLGVRYLEPSRHRNPVLRTIRVLFGVPRACVFWAALVTGSVRFRSLLL